jgi:enoyl-CoA hydratase/carnithine racemase
MLNLNTTKMLAHVEDGIGWVTFNNPERRNAVSLEMWQALGDIMEAFEADPDVRLVVLRGAGDKSFVAGADISEFDKHRANAEQRYEYAKISQRGHRSLRNFSKPLIAMIRGFCIGGGLVIAVACDVRFATPGSRFGVPAAKLGLGYDYTGVVALGRLIGPSRTADVLYSARQFEAAEAQSMGLINFVVDEAELESRVREYAATISRNAPLTIRAAKASIKAFSEYAMLPDYKHIEAMVNQCFDSEDYREGRTAFMEKRKPEFKNR